MGRKEQVKRSAEQKWEILQEGLKSGNVAETCRKHGVTPNLWYRWRDEAEAGAKGALGGRSAAGGVDQEQAKHVKQLERAVDRKQLEIEVLKNVLGE
jgi:transposase-like protein